MTRIADLLDAGPTLSFELFPPKTDDAERALEKCVVELAEMRPSFVSVTYGALGSTRERTRDVVTRINGEQAFPAMPHLTCVGHTRADIARAARPLRRQRRGEHLGPGRRSAGRRLPARRRLRLRDRARRAGAGPPGRILGGGGRPSRDPSSFARPNLGSPAPRRQAPSGRLRDDPVLLLDRRLPPARRRAGRARLRQAGAPRDHALREPQRPGADGGHERHRHPRRPPRAASTAWPINRTRSPSSASRSPPSWEPPSSPRTPPGSTCTPSTARPASGAIHANLGLG